MAWQRPISQLMIAAACLSLCACTAAAPAVPSNVSAAVSELSFVPPEVQIGLTVATTECMRARGYDVPLDSATTSDDSATVAGVPGIFQSEEAARSAGYASTYLDSAPNALDMFGQKLGEAERKEYIEALLGTASDLESMTLSNGAQASISKSGCVAEANTRIYGSVRDALEIQSFINEILFEAQNISSAKAALAEGIAPEYQRCMSDEGYQVEGFFANDLAEEAFGQYRQPGDPPSSEEQDLASADFVCQQQVQFAPKLEAMFVDNAAQWMLENEGTIVGLKEKLDEARERAQGVVDGTA